MTRVEIDAVFEDHPRLIKSWITPLLWPEGLVTVFFCSINIHGSLGPLSIANFGRCEVGCRIGFRGRNLVEICSFLH